MSKVKRLYNIIKYSKINVFFGRYESFFSQLALNKNITGDIMMGNDRDLKENKLLTTQQHIKHMVNVHERCNTEVEFLVTKQWFIKTLKYKKELIKQKPPHPR